MGTGDDVGGKDSSTEDAAGSDRHILPRGEAQRRVQLGALLVGVAVATIALPSLIMGPGDDDPPATSPPPMAVSAPASTPVGPPASSGSPTPVPSSAAASPRSGAATPSGGSASRPVSGSTASGTTPRCAAEPEGNDVTLTAAVSCGVYNAGFGNGWRATGDGLKLLPGWKVPDTGEVGLRVERTRPGLPQTEMALIAARPVRIDGDDVLRFRVWGGRDYGTVLRVSVSPAGRGMVTVSAGADRWTNYSVRLGQLTGAASLTRIDLVVAADEVPQVNRFYLDDIAIVG